MREMRYARHNFSFPREQAVCLPQLPTETANEREGDRSGAASTYRSNKSGDSPADFPTGTSSPPYYPLMPVNAYSNNGPPQIT